jgi:hypothetical protein
MATFLQTLSEKLCQRKNNSRVPETLQKRNGKATSVIFQSKLNLEQASKNK